ncbi:MAG: M48 family metalloprotease [Desulfofustis sp.]|nr:M48 family metalloprotease [Desulfofustis sp.]NNF47580.1 M48 family metalloprotease [Desulfofustis sp.]NNK58479.1 M48 family metalloprotease [Desulfofustis sp.]
MIYTNLLIFIAVIFLFSIAPAGESAAHSFLISLGVYGLSLAGFQLLVKRLFSSSQAAGTEGYFGAERKLSIAALLLFSLILFVSDVKYYLSFLSAGGLVPALTNIGGLLLFFSYLALIWRGGHHNYAAVFGGQQSSNSLVAINLRFNLALVLPWIALSLMYDILGLIPSNRITLFLDSLWGDIFFLGLFLILVLLFFPPLVRRLWNCTELEDGPLKEHLVAFCRRQNFDATLCVWPLYEGRLITAAVLGMMPGLRFILLTPALMQNLNMGELEAVMTHEIGHVKYRHLLLYVLLIGGFSLVAGLLAEPILYLSLSMDWIFQLIAKELVSAETIIMLVGGLPLLVLLLFYFRFVFGYFIRNFERQADLYVFKILGSGRQLISAFEKIVVTSGLRADKPNWHHFGIGERITQIELCEKDPSLIARQDRKIRLSLGLYAAVLVSVLVLIDRLPADQLARNYEGKYIETVLVPKLHGAGSEASRYRLLGDLFFSRGLEDRSLTAYSKALQLNPIDPEVLNNFAWLLLTSSDHTLRDPEKALLLARSAAELSPLPHVLDTLATAFWANGFIEEAIATEHRALEKDTQQAPFYRLQLERFQNEQYHNSTQFIN